MNRTVLVFAALFASACVLYALLPHTEVAQLVGVLPFAAIVLYAVRHVSRRTGGPLVRPSERLVSAALVPSLVGMVVAGLITRTHWTAVLAWMAALTGFTLVSTAVAAWERELTRDPRRLHQFFNQPW